MSEEPLMEQDDPFADIGMHSSESNMVAVPLSPPLDHHDASPGLDPVTLHGDPLLLPPVMTAALPSPPASPSPSHSEPIVAPDLGNPVSPEAGRVIKLEVEEMPDLFGDSPVSPAFDAFNVAPAPLVQQGLQRVPSVVPVASVSHGYHGPAAPIIAPAAGATAAPLVAPASPLPVVAQPPAFGGIMHHGAGVPRVTAHTTAIPPSVIAAPITAPPPHQASSHGVSSPAAFVDVFPGTSRPDVTAVSGPSSGGSLGHTSGTAPPPPRIVAAPIALPPTFENPFVTSGPTVAYPGDVNAFQDTGSVVLNATYAAAESKATATGPATHSTTAAPTTSPTPFPIQAPPFASSVPTHSDAVFLPAADPFDTVFPPLASTATPRPPLSVATDGQPGQTAHRVPPPEGAPRPPPCPVICFGFGGTLVTMFPRKPRLLNVLAPAPGATSSPAPLQAPLRVGPVTMTPLAHILRPCCPSLRLLEQLPNLAAPSSGTPAAAHTALTARLERLQASPHLTVEQERAEALLVRVLQYALAHGGRFVDPNGVPAPELTQLVASIDSGTGGAMGGGDGGGGGGGTSGTVPVEPPRDEAQRQEAGSRLQDCLLSGNVATAVEAAADAGLWAHAFFLASSVQGCAPSDASHSLLQNLVARYTQHGCVPGSPLWTLYGAASREPMQQLFVHKHERTGEPLVLQQWPRNLAMLLACRVTGAQVDPRLLMARLGDHLWQHRRCVAAAHVAHLLAGTPFGPARDANTRLVLVGADHKLCPHRYVSPEAVWSTMLLEYARRQGNAQYVLQSALPFKLAYASMLAEWGLLSQAYDHVYAVIRRLSEASELARALGPVFVEAVRQFEERLHMHLGEQRSYRNASATRLLAPLLTGVGSAVSRAWGALVGAGSEDEASSPLSRAVAPPVVVPATATASTAPAPSAPVFHGYGGGTTVSAPPQAQVPAYSSIYGGAAPLAPSSPFSPHGTAPATPFPTASVPSMQAKPPAHVPQAVESEPESNPEPVSVSKPDKEARSKSRGGGGGGFFSGVFGGLVGLVKGKNPKAMKLPDNDEIAESADDAVEGQMYYHSELGFVRKGHEHEVKRRVATPPPSDMDLGVTVAQPPTTAASAPDLRALAATAEAAASAPSLSSSFTAAQVAQAPLKRSLASTDSLHAPQPSVVAMDAPPPYSGSLGGPPSITSSTEGAPPTGAPVPGLSVSTTGTSGSSPQPPSASLSANRQRMSVSAPNLPGSAGSRYRRRGRRRYVDTLNPGTNAATVAPMIPGSTMPPRQPPTGVSIFTPMSAPLPTVPEPVAPDITRDVPSLVEEEHDASGVGTVGAVSDALPPSTPYSLPPSLPPPSSADTNVDGSNGDDEAQQEYEHVVEDDDDNDDDDDDEDPFDF